MPTHTPAERAKFRRNRDEDELLTGFRRTAPVAAGGFRVPSRPSQTAPIAGTPSIGSITREQEMQAIVEGGPAVGFTKQLQFGDTELDAEGRVSTPIGFRDAPGGLSASPIVIGGSLPTTAPATTTGLTQPIERIQVPEGLDRTQTQPQSGFRQPVPQGNFIQGAGGTLTEAGGGFDLSGPRFTAGVAEELARRGEGAAFIPGEGFRGTGTQPQAATTEGFRQTPAEEADELAALRAFSTRQDPTQTSLRVSGRLGIGEGGPAQFEGLSPTEIVAQQEQEALAEGTVGGFRTAQALQGRRLAEREVAATETTAAASLLGVQQRLQATAVKAASDAAKLTGFEFDTVSEERPVDPENPLLGTEKVITGFKGKTKGGALPTLIPLEEMTAFRTALANARTKEDKDRLTDLFTARYLSQPG